MVKNLPAIWETLPWALGQKELLEKEWKPTPVFLPEELHGLRSWWPTAHGVAELDMTESLTLPPPLSETQPQLSNLYFIWQPYQCNKKQRHYFDNKGLYSQSYGASSSYVWMWEADPKKDWALKHCFQIVVLEKTLGLQEAQTSPS